MLRDALSDLRYRLRSVFRRSDVERDLADEIRFHLERETEKLVTKGVAPDEARRQARLAFGGVEQTKEAARDARGVRWVEQVGQDLRYAVRGLKRSPGFCLTIVVTIALGVGANTVVYSLLDRLFIRPPAGVVNPSAVRRIYANYRGSPFAQNGSMVFPWLNYPEVRALYTVVDSARLGIYTPNDSANVGPLGHTVPARVSYVNPSYFSVLGVRAAIGRVLIPAEGRVDTRAPVAVFSERFWRGILNADSSVVGRAIDVDGKRYTVIGVAAADFTGVELDATDLWLPLGDFDGTGSRPGLLWYNDTGNYLQMLTRVASPGEAQQLRAAGSTALRHALTAVYGRLDTSTVLETGPILAARTSQVGAAPELGISARLGGVALIVLLIACANVANLLLLRAMRRQHEIAIRLALGVSRARLIVLLLTESLVLALLGGAAAGLIALWGGGALRHLLMPHIHWSGGAVDGRLVLFTGVVAILTGLAAGLAPALQSSRPALVQSLKSGAREGTFRRSRLRSGLLIAQAALSLVLLVGAALFVRSLHDVESIRLGYDSDRLVFATVSGESDVRHQPDVTAQLAAVATRLASAPGVESVVLAYRVPLSGSSMWAVFTPGRDSMPNVDPRGPSFSPVVPGYFRTTGVRIVLGRPFTVDDRAGAPLVAIVNQTMARLVWPGQNPIGKCLEFVTRTAPCATVVGVAADAHREGIIEDPSLQYYVPLAQEPNQLTPRSLIIRATPGGAVAVAALTRRVLTQTLLSGQDARVTTMAETLAPELRSWRLGATLFTAFGLLALLVAAVGIYAVVAYTFAQRTHEMGVRIALGAQARDVFPLVLREGLAIVAVGVGIGILLTLALARLVASLLYGVSARDPLTLIGAALVLLVIAGAASLLPALRASRVDPMEVLRPE